MATKRRPRRNSARFDGDYAAVVRASSVVPHVDTGRHSCTADQELERCAVDANRAQEVHEGPS